jgi:hypothetical protein
MGGVEGTNSTAPSTKQGGFAQAEANVAVLAFASIGFKALDSSTPGRRPT